MFKKYLWNFFGGIFLAEYIPVIHDQVNSIGGIRWAFDVYRGCISSVHIGVHRTSKEVKKYQKGCKGIKVLEANKIRGLGRF